MTGRVDTAEGRRLLANHEAEGDEATTRASGWLFDNADALLAAAEERDTLREALEAIAGDEPEKSLAGAEWIARRALAAVEARLGEPA